MFLFGWKISLFRLNGLTNIRRKYNPILSISIIGLRNIINHQYYDIEHDRIWIVIKKNIPILEAEVRKILEDYERRLELNEL